MIAGIISVNLGDLEADLMGRPGGRGSTSRKKVNKCCRPKLRGCLLLYYLHRVATESSSFLSAFMTCWRPL